MLRSCSIEHGWGVLHNGLVGKLGTIAVNSLERALCSRAISPSLEAMNLLMQDKRNGRGTTKNGPQHGGGVSQPLAPPANKDAAHGTPMLP
jgi:hypothetical protein